MLFSNRFGFLFVHIAKTGGTSIRDALARTMWRDPWYYLQWPCRRLDHLSGHRIAAKLPRHCRAIAAQEVLPRDIYRELFKFTVVRNPWDWQVSCYHHLLREKPELLVGHESFAEYLRWKFEPGRPYTTNLDTTLRPQLEHLVDLQGQMIIDHIARFESLQQDFDEVCERLRLPRVELPHHRKSERTRDYRQYYDDETAEAVATMYQKDVEAFGYQFDRPDAAA